MDVREPVPQPMSRAEPCSGSTDMSSNSRQMRSSMSDMGSLS